MKPVAFTLIIISIYFGLSIFASIKQSKDVKTEVKQEVNAKAFSNDSGILDIQALSEGKKDMVFSLVLEGKKYLGTVKVFESTEQYIKIIGIFDSKDGGFGIVIQKDSITGNASIGADEYGLFLNKEKAGIQFKKKVKKEEPENI
jgi:hypothetical protein